MNWTVFSWTLGGICTGLLLAYGFFYPIVRYLKRELREAQDRLYGAWEQGKVIPPRSDEPLEMALPPLPPDLLAYVDEWESPDSRLAVEATIRTMQAKGMTPAQMHNHFATERLRVSE